MAMIINHEHMRPKEKLKYLIRLARLCCEQVEESNEYFSDAFAWHSDLMLDHLELFWSLFSVDIDKVLSELNGSSSAMLATTAKTHQPAQQAAQTTKPGAPLPRGLSHQASFSGGSGTGSGGVTVGGGLANAASRSMSTGEVFAAGDRQVFTLFQIINDHMRTSPNLECHKFKAYLCDTFKPRLLRYVDIMESTLTRSLFKACEKDSQINCQLMEQMFAKLDDLQRFVIYQLRWPEEQLAEQLHQRLKLIAYELCDAAIHRTMQAFQQSERRSNKWTATSTSYVAPVDMVLMINQLLEIRSRSLKLCTFKNFDQMSYHSKIDKQVENALDEMQPGLMTKMISALESTLTKLARYDEGNLLAPILSLTTKQGMSSSGRDIGKQYVQFVSNCCDCLRQKINDELWIVNLIEEWYAVQMNIICTWLGERIDHSLHEVQLTALINILPKIYADMSLQGVAEDKLNLKTYQAIMNRLKMEEASSMASGTNLFEQPASSIFNTSLLSSLTSSASSGGPTSIGSIAPVVGDGPSMVLPAAPVAGSTSNLPASSSSLRNNHQHHHHHQRVESSNQSRRLPNLSSSGAVNMGAGQVSSAGVGQRDGSQQQQQSDSDNIADRALQSATKMFKGFWA